MQREFSEVVVSADKLSIDINLRESLHAAALTPKLEAFVGFDGFQTMSNGQPFKQLPRTQTPGTPGENCQLDSFTVMNGFLKRLLRGWRDGQTAEAEEKLRPLQHNGSWLQMTTPHLTGTV